MRAVLPLLVLLAGCEKKEPKSVPDEIPAQPPEEATPEEPADEGRESKEIWGGVSGFKSFVITDLNEGGPPSLLGSFAVLMPAAKPKGFDDADSYGWKPSSAWAGLEAWEWSGPAWPEGGFRLKPDSGATRGTAEVNVFQHAAFSAESSQLPAPVGAEVRTYRLKNGSQELGWFVAELNGSEVQAIHWLAEPSLGGDLISVDAADGLRFEPAPMPPGMVGLPISQTPIQAPAPQ